MLNRQKMKKFFFLMLSALCMQSPLNADYYDVLNKGLTTIDPAFSKRYSYPLNDKSPQEAINAACNRQQNFIIQELKKAKSGSQARQQLITDQREISTACSVLGILKSRAEYTRSKEEIEQRKKEEKELEDARLRGSKALEEKKRGIEGRKEGQKKSPTPQTR